MSAGYAVMGPALDVHLEDGHWWATCPGCPNWSVAADSWSDLFRLVSEWHHGLAPHRAWHMTAPITTGPTTVKSNND